MRARAVRVRNCATFSKTCKHICRHMQGADWQYYGYARLVKTRWQEMLRPRIAERCSYCHERLLTDPLVHRFYSLFFFCVLYFAYPVSPSLVQVSSYGGCCSCRPGDFAYHSSLPILHVGCQGSLCITCIMNYKWLPVVPHKAVAEVSRIGHYRRDWLLWVTDGRAKTLMDWTVQVSRWLIDELTNWLID